MNYVPCIYLFEIDKAIMFNLDNKTLATFSKINRYTYSLYHNNQFWITKINNLYPKFPIFDTFQDKSFRGFINGKDFNIPIKYPLNIIGLYHLLSERCDKIEKLEMRAMSYAVVPVIKWLFHKYGIKPTENGFSNAIYGNRLDYIKFLYEDCGYKMDDFYFEEAILSADDTGELEILEYLATKTELIKQ